MDLADPLAGLRQRFIVDDENALYMDGNSLGRQPTDAAAQVAKALEAWRSDLIIAWREWIRVPGRLGDLIAQSVVEARPGDGAGRSTAEGKWRHASEHEATPTTFPLRANFLNSSNMARSSRS